MEVNGNFVLSASSVFHNLKVLPCHEIFRFIHTIGGSALL